jgi:hypothetical protein
VRSVRFRRRMQQVERNLRLRRHFVSQRLLQWHDLCCVRLPVERLLRHRRRELLGVRFGPGVQLRSLRLQQYDVPERLLQRQHLCALCVGVADQVRDERRVVRGLHQRGLRSHYRHVLMRR